MRSVYGEYTDNISFPRVSARVLQKYVSCFSYCNVCDLTQIVYTVRTKNTVVYARLTRRVCCCRRARRTRTRIGSAGATWVLALRCSHAHTRPREYQTLTRPIRPYIQTAVPHTHEHKHITSTRVQTLTHTRTQMAGSYANIRRGIFFTYRVFTRSWITLTTVTDRVWLCHVAIYQRFFVKDGQTVNRSEVILYIQKLWRTNLL